ncbi:MAG: 7TM-DISM domain-containing protein, partial [Rhizobacter sp.]
MPSRRARSLFLWCLALLVGGLLCVSGLRAQETGGRALVLDGGTDTVDAWSAATLRFDPTRSLTLDDVLADPAGFKPPETDHPTFGVRKDALWVRVPLDVRCQKRCPWVLDIDYTAIAYIDAFLLTEGRLVQRIELGNLRPFAERPLGARSHAAVLDLRPGSRQELVLRIETKGAMIVPVTLNTPAHFHSHALNEQMLQGLLSGLGICLLLYSVAQGIGLRESLFLKYALMISGSIVFS